MKRGKPYKEVLRKKVNVAFNMLDADGRDKLARCAERLQKNQVKKSFKLN